LNNSNNCVGHTIPESTRPSQTPAPSVRPPIVFWKTLRAHLLRPRFPPSLESEHPQTPAPKHRRILSSSAGSTSQRPGGTSSSLPSSPFGLGGAGLGMPKTAVDIQANVLQTTLKGNAWAWAGCDEDSCERASSGGLEAGVRRYRHASASSRTGEARGTPGGKFVVGVHRIALTGAAPLKYVS